MAAQTDRGVALDPKRNFGHPIVFETGVPTLTLARSVKANQSIQEVARWFEISPKAVKEAVAFDSNWLREFFFDNNLAPKLARTMSAAIEPEHKVVHLKERFPANAEDKLECGRPQAKKIGLSLRQMFASGETPMKFALGKKQDTPSSF